MLEVDHKQIFKEEKTPFGAMLGYYSLGRIKGMKTLQLKYSV